jgi:hypothetical protein
MANVVAKYLITWTCEHMAVNKILRSISEPARPPLPLHTNYNKMKLAPVSVGEYSSINPNKLLTPKFGTGRSLICGPSLVKNPSGGRKVSSKRFGRGARGRQFASVRQRDCLR